jgi:hypothetical protein
VPYTAAAGFAAAVPLDSSAVEKLQLAALAPLMLPLLLLPAA